MAEDQEPVNPPAEGTADLLLVQLIDFAERGIGFPVSLCVGGLVITGKLISFRHYLEGLADTLDAATTNSRELLDSYTQGLREGALRIPEANPQTDGHIAERSFLHYYIHLQDVTIYGASRIPMETKYWRGRLDFISGFTYGQIMK